MSRLDSATLLAGLQQLGPATATATVTGRQAHATLAFLTFRAQHANLVDISPLQHYPYLQNIDLSHNSLDSLSVLSACASLRTLDVSHNSLRVLLDFAAPRALRQLNYSHNLLSGALSSVPLLANRYLEQLDLSVNQLESVAGVGQLSQLRVLNVARNQLATLEDISAPALTTLDVSGNFIKSLSSLPVRSLGALRTMILDDNQLTELPGVEELGLLSVLSLRDNAIADMDEVARLVACTQLVELDLRGNPLADSGSGGGDGDPSAAAADDVPYRLRLLHLLPGLQVLDGVPVTAEEVVDAHNAHGADQPMRRAIVDLFLPQGQRTKPFNPAKSVQQLFAEEERS